MAKKLGEVVVERDWLEGKLVSLDLSTRKELVDNEGKVQAKQSNKKITPSLNRQLQLLHLSKTAYYYEPVMPFSSDEDYTVLLCQDQIQISFYSKQLCYPK